MFNHLAQKAFKKIKEQDSWKQYFNPQYILVDEFQDCNKIQLDILYQFIRKNNNISLLMMGDPDQNIYEWRYSFKK